MSTIPAGRVAEIFVEVADTLVDDFDLVEFLQMLSTRTTELVGADAAGLLVADPAGELQFMAASDESMASVELFQLQYDEGPCLDAYRTGRSVVEEDLRQGGRWPRFAQRATTAGLRSVHALPLRLRSETIGALGIFGRRPGDLQPADVRVIQALAHVATIALLQERAVHHGQRLTEQLQTALTSRIVIEQAKGVVAERQ